MNDIEAIRNVQRRWFRATMSGDLSMLDSLMTADVVFLSPGRPPFGRKEFFKSFQAMKDQVTMECEGEFIEIKIDGDLAVATGLIQITVTPRFGGEPTSLTGNTLTVFNRQPDGRWLLSRDANLVAPN
ncbi:YybH family protein [Rhodopirellula sp. MGV]|uniref:YybH family protein n=1 Tax=Rhodopirellula sp. MGV TaxID=2023130 RepID=UPI000B963648|nr:SgcJ/EcaC family oxidoreductase [Rhodopirellula sp. MGV]OYP35152.1 hypothetical protein CGZ80_12165 [Rhodopirellula sp. MGV]PNY36772.1 DUF4440 domain-containing protein [Rhodopirellula baltica]